MSCIDCGKPFYGQEFKSHTSCISEAEKYEGKLYKGNKRKGGNDKPNSQPKKRKREETKEDVVRTIMTETLKEHREGLGMRKLRKLVKSKYFKTHEKTKAAKTQLVSDILLTLSTMPVNIKLIQ